MNAFALPKLVVSDMDGTLLNARGELPRDFFDVYNQLRARGIQFCAASGRQLYNLHEIFAPVRDEMIFIAENGSFVVDGARAMFVRSLSRDAVTHLLATARTLPGVNLVLCGKRAAYVESDAPAFLREVEKYYARRQFVPDLGAVDDAFLKIAIFHADGVEAHAYPRLRHLEREFLVKVSGFPWIDLSHVEANKGAGLDAVQAALGVRPDETVVFGDYLNDLEMMQQSTRSYAMANAHPAIKSVARFHAPSNEDDGVMHVLRTELLSARAVL